MPLFADLVENTRYINLAHRTDRLAEVVAELEKMGIRGTRFNAIKTANGAIGCSLSHLKCLEEAAANDWPYVFICEDDICFTNPDLLKTNIELFHENEDILWDMLIVGGNNVPPYQQVEPYCARVFYCQTTTGYIVKRHYYDTLLANFRESAGNLMRNPENRREYSLDIYWKKLQIQDFWYMITPPTVTQYESYSDIENRSVNYEGLLLDMDKTWLFRQSR
jgi:GR25 family glycosyltransferase involved in LPS biosynthesis